MGRLLTGFCEIKWGARGLILLYVSVVSGIILALQYDFANPFYSAVAQEALIPFGSFWRSLHFYSSQLFFLFCLVHLLAVIINGSIFKMAPLKWLVVLATLPLAVLLLFTGYVLRGDSTGESAGMIAEQIALAIPLAGDMVNNFLFAISAEGMKRVYANHLAGLAVLWLICAWDHLRRYRVMLADHGLLLVITVVLSVFLLAPMEVLSPGVLHIGGPWFFLGLQELLRVIDPFWAGVVLPLFLFVLLALVRLEGRVGRIIASLVVVMLVFYAWATFLALGR